MPAFAQPQKQHAGPESSGSLLSRAGKSRHEAHQEQISEPLFDSPVQSRTRSSLSGAEEFATRSSSEQSTTAGPNGLPRWSIGTISLLPSGTRAIQTKLTVNRPGDRYEQEADRVADRVMRSSGATTVEPMKAGSNIGLQRECACGGSCSQCQADHHDDDQKQIQRSSLGSFDSEQTIAPPSVDEALHSPGSPLDSTTRAFMEARFGHDFSGVRVHSGSAAQRSAQEIHAKAYTVGHHIVFGANRFTPQTHDGQHLIAHELTHVIQQSSGHAARTAHVRQTPLQRCVQRDPVKAQEPAMSRPAEIASSKNSPGEFEIKAGFPPVLSFFNFAIDDHHLKAEHKANLKTLSELLGLVDASDWQVSIVGNTDNTGGPEINDPLSINRANEVRKYLSTITKGNFIFHGEGENQPVTTNESVSGRSRNRRVDILFNNPHFTLPVPKKIDPDICKRFPELCDEKGFCQNHPHVCRFCLEHPVWCAIGLLCILFPPACACVASPVLCACGRFPALCACLADPEACLPGRKKKDDKPKRKRACPTRVDLPSGVLVPDKVETLRYAKLSYPFAMKLDFAQDTSGCECVCGEYTQLVRGYFDRDKNGKGTWKRETHELTPGVYLEEKTFHEDGTPLAGPYGHRNNRPAENDKFLPDRAAGCEYRGTDIPSVESHNKNNARIRMHLEFVGGPADVCEKPGQRLGMQPHWRNWIISGEAQAKAPPSKPTLLPKDPPDKPPGKKGPELENPVVTNLPVGKPRPSWYAGGIPSNAISGLYKMQVAFEVDGAIRGAVVPVRIDERATTKATVTVITTNDKNLNVNPEHPTPIIMGPHRVEKFERSMLKQFDETDGVTP